MIPASLKLVASDGASIDPPANQDTALGVCGLTVSYGEAPVVFSVDLDIPKGAFVGIVGPNGAGKSTLLKAIMGITPCLSGRVLVDGRNLADSRTDIAYVPQRASVDWSFPTCVQDVVLMGLYNRIRLLGRIGTAERRVVRDCLYRVGMIEFADRQIGKLSGGQQQRVFLARALAQKAKLLLLDEPFAGVDAATEATIISVLKALQDAGTTILCVHHDLATVTAYFDHLALINVKLIAAGRTKDVFTPALLQQTYGGRLASAQIDRLNVG
jgi:manganese/zinc/iron transport system ATP- binding protein